MKVKVKTPDRFVVSFSRRELNLMNNCLHEACHGLIMDRFLPARPDLMVMLDSISLLSIPKDLFTVKPAIL